MALQDALVSLARLHWRLPIAPARRRRRRPCRPHSTAPSACSLDANARLEDARVGEDCSVTRPHACAVMHSRPQPREVLATEKGSQTRASSRRGLRQRRPEHAQDAVQCDLRGRYRRRRAAASGAWPSSVRRPAWPLFCTLPSPALLRQKIGRLAAGQPRKGQRPACGAATCLHSTTLSNVTGVMHR